MSSRADKRRRDRRRTHAARPPAAQASPRPPRVKVSKAVDNEAAASPEEALTVDEEVEVVGPKPLWKRRYVAWPVIITAAGTAGAATAPDNMLTGFALAAAMATLSVVCVAGWARLAKPLGRVTAVAAMACVWAVVIGLASWASSDCPAVSGPAGAGRCDASEVAIMGLNGLLIPVLVGFIVLPAIIVGSRAKKVFKYMAALVTGRRAR